MIQISNFAVLLAKVVPHAELVPCGFGVEFTGQSGQARCVDWSPGSLHKKVAAGYSDGKYSIEGKFTLQVV